MTVNRHRNSRGNRRDGGRQRQLFVKLFDLSPMNLKADNLFGRTAPLFFLQRTLANKALFVQMDQSGETHLERRIFLIFN